MYILFVNGRDKGGHPENGVRSMHRHDRVFAVVTATCTTTRTGASATTIRTGASATIIRTSATTATISDVIGAGHQVSHLQPLVVEVPLQTSRAATAHGPAHLG